MTGSCAPKPRRRRHEHGQKEHNDAGRDPPPRVHEQENGRDHASGPPAAIDQAGARRPARNRDPGPDGVRGPVDERGDRIQGGVQTHAPAQTGRLPRRQGTRRLRLAERAHAGGLAAQRARIPRIPRRSGGRGHVRASRHRQDPPRHRVGQEGLPAGRAGAVLHRRGPGHEAPARQHGRQTRPGTASHRQGPHDRHRRARLRAHRRGRQQTPVPGRHQRVRDPEHRLHHQHRVQRMGQGVRRPQHGRRDHRPHRPPRQDDQIRGRILQTDPRPHAITKQPKPDETSRR